MIPVICVILSLESINNFVSLKTYISQNAKIHCGVYFINEDLPNYPRVNVIEKNKDDFFKYLDSVNIEHKQLGGYYFFNPKAKQ